LGRDSMVRLPVSKEDGEQVGAAGQSTLKWDFRQKSSVGKLSGGVSFREKKGLLSNEKGMTSKRAQNGSSRGREGRFFLKSGS